MPRTVQSCQATQPTTAVKILTLVLLSLVCSQAAIRQTRGAVLAESAETSPEAAPADAAPQHWPNRTTGLPKFPKTISTPIDGAPLLQQPTWLPGDEWEVRTEKHGLIYPAVFDWNRDGLLDLLLGEFETGETGSYVQVHLNTGSSTSPKFSGEYFYATDTEGQLITNHQWCCIGIHPRVIDLDGDGHLDLLSGQYNPGLVSWWRGSPDGFLPRQFVPQQGYVQGQRLTHDDPPWDPAANSYWNYTSVDFADFDGDGLIDMFVGGSDGLRVALNTGSKSKPEFGLRKYLLDMQGHPLNVAPLDEEFVKHNAENARYDNLAGVGKSYITPIDWNDDGAIDLLVTHEYNSAGHRPIEFFQGVKTQHGLRFLPQQPLLTTADGAKPLPGCQPMLCVTDFDSDGTRDLLVGISVPTINGHEVADDIAWRFLHDLKLQSPGKDAGRSLKYYGGLEETVKRMQEQPFLKQYLMGSLDDHKYLTMRHRGYMMLLRGQPNPKTATPAQTAQASPAVPRQRIKNELVAAGPSDQPVTVSVKVPERITLNKQFEIEVQLDFDDNWFGYVDCPANRDAGHIPTKITIALPEELEKLGELITPEADMHLRGSGLVFKQKFRYPIRSREQMQNMLEKAKIRVTVRYQVCNDQLCRPPEKLEFNFTPSVKYM